MIFFVVIKRHGSVSPSSLRSEHYRVSIHEPENWRKPPWWDLIMIEFSEKMIGAIQSSCQNHNETNVTICLRSVQWKRYEVKVEYSWFLRSKKCSLGHGRLFGVLMKCVYGYMNLSFSSWIEVSFSVLFLLALRPIFSSSFSSILEGLFLIHIIIITLSFFVITKF